MNQSTWIEQGRQLYSTHANSQFAIGDWLVEGEKSFGREAAFEAVKQIAPSNTRNFFTRCMSVASYYPASLRVPLPFHTFEVLKRFPISFLEEFLPKISTSRSCAQILALAVEQYRSDPRRKYKIEFHVVRVPIKLYHALSAHATAPDKTHMLVWKILSEWEQQQGAGKSTEGSAEAAGNSSDDAQPRPETTYAPESPKRAFIEAVTKRKKCTCRIKLVWTECKGRGANSNLRGDSFPDNLAAEIAQAKYEACHGYAPFVSFCELCSAFHLHHFPVQASLQEHAQA